MPYYEGEFRNGQMHGSGTIHWEEAEGELRLRYDGLFADNKRVAGASCKLVYRSLDTYVGELDGQYTPHGSGRKTYAEDGDYYEGEWKGGKSDGQGKLVSGEQTYVGAFVLGNKEGEGVMSYADGAEYRGNWSENEQSGQGTLKYASGDVYTGEWRKGMQDRGVLRFANGDCLTGTFRENVPHGPDCRKEFANGDVFVGEYSKGKRIKGKTVFADGTVYEGEMRDGKAHGRGRLVFAGALP